MATKIDKKILHDSTKFTEIFQDTQQLFNYSQDVFGYKVLPLGRLQVSSWPSYLPKDVLRMPDTFLKVQVFSIVTKLCFIIEMKIIYLLQSLFCCLWFWAVNKRTTSTFAPAQQCIVFGIVL